MDTPHPDAPDVATEPTFTAEERAMIDAAEADVAAGRFVAWETLQAWFDAVEHGDRPAVPQSLSRG